MKKDKELVCNVCGKVLVEKNGVLQEDGIEVVKEWGYFSKYDLESHHFIICEECYDKMIKSFAVPIERLDKSEAL